MINDCQSWTINFKCHPKLNFLIHIIFQILYTYLLFFLLMLVILTYLHFNTIPMDVCYYIYISYQDKNYTLSLYLLPYMDTYLNTPVNFIILFTRQIRRIKLPYVIMDRNHQTMLLYFHILLWIYFLTYCLYILCMFFHCLELHNIQIFLFLLSHSLLIIWVHSNFCYIYYKIICYFL